MEAFVQYATLGFIAMILISGIVIMGADNDSARYTGFVGVILGFTLLGSCSYFHMSPQSKLELATKTFQEGKAAHFTTYFRDEVDTIANAINEIARHQQKIQLMADNLEKKSGNVSDARSKKIFENKIASLNNQKAKLNASVTMLEQCAFEKILLKNAEILSGEGDLPSDFDTQVQRELKLVEQVMREVNNIQS